MPTNKIRIRPAGPGDEAGWRRLWDGYLRFYEHELPEATTDATWRRIIDTGMPHIGAVIAEYGGGPEPVGMVNYVVHDITWSTAPVCYLEDLFVDEACRGSGIGRALIEHIVEMGRAQGWHRIYWQTARDNVQAQRLYNKVAERTGWVRYDIDLA